jgi:hypothetical protein
MTRKAIGEREFAENLDKDSNAVAHDVHLAYASDSRGFVAVDFLYDQFQFGRGDAAADFPSVDQLIAAAQPAPSDGAPFSIQHSAGRRGSHPEDRYSVPKT